MIIVFCSLVGGQGHRGHLALPRTNPQNRRPSPDEEENQAGAELVGRDHRVDRRTSGKFFVLMCHYFLAQANSRKGVFV